MTIKPGILKALYIEANIAERNASEVLETAVANTSSFLSSNFLCVFTVASNIFTGLEFTEHTCYDLILINHDLTRNIDAVKFARILRKVGVQTPLILVKEDSSSDLLEVEGGSLFCCLLQKPFSSTVLCDAMHFSLKRNISSLSTKPHFHKVKRGDGSKRKVTKRNKKDIENIIDSNCNPLDPFPDINTFPIVMDPLLDTNIDRLLQQGDFDLVYLSNCALLPRTMAVNGI